MDSPKPDKIVSEFDKIVIVYPLPHPYPTPQFNTFQCFLKGNGFVVRIKVNRSICCHWDNPFRRYLRRTLSGFKMRLQPYKSDNPMQRPHALRILRMSSFYNFFTSALF